MANLEQLQEEYRNLCEETRNDRISEKTSRKEELRELIAGAQPSRYIFDGEYVICPHCGNQMGDCWEWVTEDYTEETCEVCGGRFGYWAEYSVSYCTKKA